MAAADLTKKALVTTLKALLESKRLDKLTVREVCTATGVSTSTFYYHYPSATEPSKIASKRQHARRLSIFNYKRAIINLIKSCVQLGEKI